MKPISRWLLSGLGTLLSLVALLMFGTYLLVFTEAGTRWLLGQALTRSPALQVAEVHGTLATGLTFSNLSWQDGDLDVRIESFALRGDATCLWRMTLCLPVISAAGIDGRSTAAPAENAVPVQLPGFLWPLRVEAHSVRIDQVRWQSALDEAASPVTVDSLRFRAEAQGRRLALSDLSVSLPGHAVSGELELRTTSTWKLRSALELTSDRPDALKDWLPDEQVRLVVKTEGALNALAVTGRLEGGLPASARVVIDALAIEPTLDGTLEVPAWSWQAGAVAGALRELRATFQGSAAQLQFDVAAKLHQLEIQDAPQVPRGEIAVTGRWKDDALPGLTFSYLSGDGAHAVNWQGSVAAAAEPLQVSGNVRIRSDRLATWAPALDGQLRATTPVRVMLQDDVLQLRLEALRLEGEAQGESFSVTTTVAARSGPDGVQPRLERAGGRIGPAQVSAAGDVLPRIELRGQLEVARLTHAHPDARGAARATFRLAGEPANPVLSFNASVSEPAWQTYRAEALKATGNVVTGEGLRLDVQLDASGLAGLPEALPLQQARLRLAGTLEELRVGLAAEGPDSTLELETDVYPGEQETRIRIDEGVFRAPLPGAWRLSDPVALQWNPARSSLRVGNDACLVGAASLCVLGGSQLLAEGDVTRLRMTRIGETLWAEHLPPGLSIRAELEGDGEVRWTATEPQLEVNLHGTAGEVALAGSGEVPAMAHGFERIELAGSVDAAATRTRLQLQSATLGQVQARLQLSRSDDTLTGGFQVDGLQFAPLRTLLPGVDQLDGRLDADIDITGTRALPVLNGTVRVADARARGAALPLEVYDLRMDARLAGEQLAFDGSFNTREEKRNGTGAGSLSGTARFDGDASWADTGRQLNLRMTGNELQVQVGGHTALVLDAGLIAHVTPDLLDARGQARIREGRIRLPRQGADAVWLADDVVLIPAPPEKAPPKPLPFATVRTALDLELGEKLSFSGHGIDGWLGGSLQITHLHTPRPRGKGTIEIRDGRYRAYGQRLTLQRGRLRFRGDLFDPSLDVEAIRPLDQVVAGVRVKGLASAPEVRLFSDPSMPEEEILSWLILGKPLGSGSAQDSQMLSAALLSYSLRTGEEQGTKLAERLGIEQFEVGTSNVDGNAGVFASGYLSPRLFVRYGVSSAEAANSLTLRYRVLPRLFLEASSGLETAVDLLYSFSF